MWSFIGAVVAALATIVAAVIAYLQGARANRRLALETTVNSLKLLTAADGERYAPPGVVAGATATLVHLGHPVVAMRALGPCWEAKAIDRGSATWVISEVFAGDSTQATLEAAALLDAHAHELCGDAAGTFFWPASIEYRWPGDARLRARLAVFRAILRTLMSKLPEWWAEGGRRGWAVALLHEAVRTDPDADVRRHAALGLRTLVPPLRAARLNWIQSAREWKRLDEIEQDVDRTLAATSEQTRQITVLASELRRLESWSTTR